MTKKQEDNALTLNFAEANIQDKDTIRLFRDYADRRFLVCYLLENRKFTKTVAQFAEWVAEYVFRNQMELWGDQLEQELTGALDIFSGERGSATSLLELLPAEFSNADLIKLRARKGQSVKGSAISMVLNRWRGNGKIEKLSDTRWKKL